MGLSLLELVIVILLVAWLMGGVVLPIGTPLIHALLVVALVLVVVRLLQGRRI